MNEFVLNLGLNPISLTNVFGYSLFSNFQYCKYIIFLHLLSKSMLHTIQISSLLFYSLPLRRWGERGAGNHRLKSNDIFWIWKILSFRFTIYSLLSFVDIRWKKYRNALLDKARAVIKMGLSYRIKLSWTWRHYIGPPFDIWKI